MALYEFSKNNRKEFVEILQSVGCIPHFHSAIEILIVEKGSIDININGNFTTLQMGDVLVTNSYDVHSYTPHSGNVGNVVMDQ